MGLVDTFGAEDRSEIKFNDLYRLTKEAAKFEILYNAVKCNVPHRFIREMVTGEPEETGNELSRTDTTV